MTRKKAESAPPAPAPGAIAASNPAQQSGPDPAAAPAPDPAGLAAAIEALIGAGVADEAARLLDRFGPGLIRAGYGETVDRCQQALERCAHQDSPRALLLHARALAQRNAVDAVAAFEAALAKSRLAGDDATALQAACGLLRVVFVIWDDFRPVAPMLAIAERAFEEGGGKLPIADPTEELECLAGLLAGRLLMRGSLARRVELFERMLALALHPDVHGAARLGAGGVLAGYCQLWNEDARGHALIGALDALRDDPSIGIEQRLVWRYEAAIFLVYSPKRDTAVVQARIDELVAAIPAEGYRLSRFQLGRVRFELAMLRYDFGAAETALAEMRGALDARLAVQAITLAHKEAVLALTLGQFDRGLAASRIAVSRAQAAHVPPFIVSIYRQIGAMAMGFGDDPDGAVAELKEMMLASEAAHRNIYELSIGTVAVAAAFRRNDPAAMTASVDALLRSAEASNHLHIFSYCPPLGARAMAYALTHGIRPETARRVVTAMRFRPPPDLPEAWPWTVRIRLLGAPSVQVDGATIGGKGKTQQRPLDLLKALAINGGGRPEGVDIQTATLALWPDADADAKVSFDVTMLRLRKLLVHDGLVTVADGRARFDLSRVWCDVWAFEAADVVERTPWSSDPLELYRGPLFGVDQVPAWALGARERLRHKFLQAVLARGEALEAARRWDDALPVYERGLEQDPIAEDFYRGSMRCHLARGDTANALRVYRRCREMLSIVLGVAPSPETEALYPR